ncbi:MAG: 30S ribosomal protein S12 methylthiotransferase RimO [Actinomycetota bacterium]
MRQPAVALVTLGCGRNEVDSAQVAGSLAEAGFTLVDDPAGADCILVNTCTFIEPAREESVDTVLEATEHDVPVLVMGCMAERYGSELAAAMPEATGVLGFADYPRLPEHVAAALGLAAPAPQAATDRRTRDGATLAVSGTNTPLPLVAPPPHAPPTAAFPVRTQPKGPWAYLKLAAGCDRACAFCTIPSYRGAFRSRPVEEILAEAQALAAAGVRELVGVSENTTSYGKDLAAGRDAQRELVAGLDRVEGLERVRLLYLQPDELTDDLIAAMAASERVVSYYDLSLQHASPDVVRAMARGGGAERYLALIERIRTHDPDAVLRSSFIVGFPGEGEADVAVLEDFLAAAGIDWTAFFVYSDEEGTPAAVLPGRVEPDEARARRDHLLDVAEAVAEERAERFVGRTLEVLVEGHEAGAAIGRSYREAPETDGEVRLPACQTPVGRSVRAEVLAADGVDLLARPLGGAA